MDSSEQYYTFIIASRYMPVFMFTARKKRIAGIESSSKIKQFQRFFNQYQIV